VERGGRLGGIGGLADAEAILAGVAGTTTGPAAPGAFGTNVPKRTDDRPCHHAAGVGDAGRNPRTSMEEQT
jgi:hypothetical protein